MHDLRHLNDRDRATFGQAYEQQFLSRSPTSSGRNRVRRLRAARSDDRRLRSSACSTHSCPAAERGHVPQLVDQLLALLLDGLNARRH
jgi:hypothetical protein